MRSGPFHFLLVGTFLGAAVLPLETPASPKDPVTIQSAVTSVPSGAALGLTCDFVSLPPGRGSLFAAYSLTDATGATRFAQFTTLNVSREVGAGVQAGNGTFPAPPLRTSLAVYDHSNTHSIQTGSGTTLRFVYTSWGAPGRCTLTVDGTPLPTAVAPADTYATFLYLNDFRKGGSVETGVVDAGAAQSYTKLHTGYLFAFLAPQRGVAQIDGPGVHLTDDTVGLTDPEFDPADGKRNDRVALGVAKQTSGAWTYSVSSVNETWGPVLWMIALP